MRAFSFRRLVIATALVGGACTATIGDRPVDATQPAIDPAPSTLHRLTQAQYANTLHDLLGASVAIPQALEPDFIYAGFATVGGSVGSVSSLGVEEYETAALGAAAQALAAGPARDAFVGCKPASVADAICARSFLATFGRRAWRRPLTSDEIDRTTAIATTAMTTLDDFYQGLAYGIAALLESPNLLYRIELGTPDPTQPGILRYQAFELASRLSYFLWNTTPDEALLDAAGEGALDTEVGYAAQVDRLLASPRARDAMKNFHMERLGLAGLDGLSKSAAVYPDWSLELGPMAREETLDLLDQLLMVENADYRELLTTRRTFVNRQLGALYGVEAPSPTSFGEVALPATGLRAGILGHASILALYAHPTSTSPTRRGKFVREVLFCAPVINPPASVNTALPTASGSGPTLRDLMVAHVANPFCASCHTAMDGIGFGLENFDGIGMVRVTDNGARVDASGALDGVRFTTPAELGAAVASDPALGPCLVRHVLRYASAAPETPGEQPAIDRLAYDFADQGYRVVGLLRAVALSAAFRTATGSP